jgi:hypothetical protein
MVIAALIILVITLTVRLRHLARRERRELAFLGRHILPFRLVIEMTVETQAM